MYPTHFPRVCRHQRRTNTIFIQLRVVYSYFFNVKTGENSQFHLGRKDALLAFGRIRIVQVTLRCSTSSEFRGQKGLDLFKWKHPLKSPPSFTLKFCQSFAFACKIVHVLIICIYTPQCWVTNTQFREFNHHILAVFLCDYVQR